MLEYMLGRTKVGKRFFAEIDEGAKTFFEKNNDGANALYDEKK